MADLKHLANADELTAIREDREPIYGDHVENHQNIGMVFGGILMAAGWKPPSEDQCGVAPDVVELMQAGLKMVRAANHRAKFHADSYNDGVNYFQMAGETKRDLEE